ncbi:hypothetical protein RJ640_017856 [Escallonia rubra]|uniref:Importin N-terminal domain-containing protein n=1 Tax=Escallonia rubra TaxID=112253 RepID=A0AA88RYR4_9ASTE|nr:hypothetical protein RJ640_017856 [Escallonia rubra]
MDNTVDQDQQWLINCLNSTLDTSQQVRSFAEAALLQASLQPAFENLVLDEWSVTDIVDFVLAALYPRLLRIGGFQWDHARYPFWHYWHTAVLVKQFIKKHWQEDEENFEHPVVSVEEKGTIRRLLLSSLDDSHKKICTAIGMAVASIAHYDWPEDWPDLLPFLLKLINDQSNMNAVRKFFSDASFTFHYENPSPRRHKLREGTKRSGAGGDNAGGGGVPHHSAARDGPGPNAAAVAVRPPHCLVLRVVARIEEGKKALGYSSAAYPDDIRMLNVLWLLRSAFPCSHGEFNLYSYCTVNGALRCLALLSSDLDDTVVPTIVPVLFPSLHAIVSSPQIYDKSLRTRALSIVYSCTSMLGVMSGAYKTETSAMMIPMLHAWMDQFSSILQHPVQSEDPDDWTIRMEVLKCLNQFVQNFPSLVESQIVVILGPLWQTFLSSLGVYERSSIEGIDDPYDGRYDSDGAEKSLESFVIQLFEFLLTIVGSRRFVKVFGNNISELVYYTIAFLQITEQQVIFVVLQFLYAGLPGALLLEEVVSSCGMEGIHAIMDAVKTRHSESQKAKAAGSAGWWRISEATLFALASVAEQMLENEVSEISGINLGTLLEQILSEDMARGVHQFPFLYARMFSSVAKFSSVINHEVVEHVLYAAMDAIGMDVSPPVKVGACRALSQLLPIADKGILQPRILPIFSTLTDLLKQASDETMHLVLETLQAAVKAGHEASVSIEPILSPIILNVWASHVSDPFISIDALEVLEAIKNSPGCLHPLVSRAMPYIGQILSKPQQQPDGLVAGSLDLVTMLLKNAPCDVVKAVYEVSFDLVVRLVLQSDDHSEMQNATQCLAALVAGGKQELLAWGGDPASTMRSLLDVAASLTHIDELDFTYRESTVGLLYPDLESSGSLFVGSFILQLILHLPSQMAQHFRDLVAALVRRMQSCQIAGLRSSLLLIFARLVHLSAPHVEQFIDLLASIPADGHVNSFVYVMSEWTKQQGKYISDLAPQSCFKYVMPEYGEIQGAYQIKVTTSALALLLSTRHVELEKIHVQGHLIKSNAGITTRSKAKLAPDQWTVASLPMKILAILADVLIEIQEQVFAGEDEDSEWEELEAGDVELNQDLIYSGGASSYSRPTSGCLDAMAKAFEENDDDGYDEDDLLSGADPLNEIKLSNYLASFLVDFSHRDRPYYDRLCQSLTTAQRDAIQMVLKP